MQLAAEAAAAEAQAERSDASHSRRLDRAGRVIIAVQPVTDEPLGLAVTRAVDEVVLCVEKGSARLGPARRALELIGRERVAGCLLVEA